MYIVHHYNGIKDICTAFFVENLIIFYHSWENKKLKNGIATSTYAVAGSSSKSSSRLIELDMVTILVTWVGIVCIESSVKSRASRDAFTDESRPVSITKTMLLINMYSNNGHFRQSTQC